MEERMGKGKRGKREWKMGKNEGKRGKREGKKPHNKKFKNNSIINA